MSNPMKSVLYPMTKVLSLSIPRYKPSFGNCLPFTNREKLLISLYQNVYGFVSKQPTKSVFFTMVNKRRLRMGPKSALSADKYFDPVENVNVLGSTLVKLYCAMLPCSQ